MQFSKTSSFWNLLWRPQQTPSLVPLLRGRNRPFINVNFRNSVRPIKL
uniref:Uncharacterized protein n=1 Tax=Anguilla anguilla TaxID=7936 RepID=A0A0E9UZP4_ANGAN